MESLKEGEWSCYGGCHFNGRENGHVTEEVSIMEGEGRHVMNGWMKGVFRPLLRTVKAELGGDNLG